MFYERLAEGNSNFYAFLTLDCIKMRLFNIDIEFIWLSPGHSEILSSVYSILVEWLCFAALKSLIKFKFIVCHRAESEWEKFINFKSQKKEVKMKRMKEKFFFTEQWLCDSLMINEEISMAQRNENFSFTSCIWVLELRNRVLEERWAHVKFSTEMISN